MIIVKQVIKITEGFAGVDEDDGKYGVVEETGTYDIVDVGEDEVIYIIVNKNADVPEENG